MKCFLVLLLGIISLATAFQDFDVPPAGVDPQIYAVKGLIARQLPNYQSLFALELIPQEDGLDVYEVDSNSNQQVVLRGSSGNFSLKVAMAMALNYWLKYHAGCSISWNGNQLRIPSPPPLPPTERFIVQSKWRYYFNTCTFGYTTAFWDWTRWEQEIDWAALNGYNMPLAFTGQEYVWRDVYNQLGVNDSALNDFFTGPAFLPWNRMGNINAWAGPLTPSWHQQQLSLQKKILTRERAFGMKPVLPGFAGHVPPAMSKLYPNANIVQLQSWCLQDGTYYLDPTDPLFSRISTLFIQRQTELFGTDHLYNFDPFNELYPPSNSTTYLANCAKNMFKAMIDADPQGIWVIQGWFLYNHASFWQEPQAKAFFGGVPIGKMLVLDLWSEEHPVWTITQSFYGHEWIWCMLHNFGGRTGMYGDLPSISSGPINARKTANNMVGTGITMEALLTNVVVYDMMNEMSWRSVSVSVPDWLTAYVGRRYGSFMPSSSMNLLQSAWSILYQTVYSCNTHQGGTTNSLIAMRPSLVPPSTTVLYYSPSSLVPALQLFVQAAPAFVNANSSTFQYDFADLTRQCLSNLFLQTHASMVTAFKTGDYNAFGTAKGLMLSIIADMETLVASQPQNLLGTWTAFARGWATNSAEAALLEWNARTQVTLWAQNSPDSVLHDYAYKLWSGLVGDFYYPRWNLFLERLDESMQFGTPFDYTAFINDVVQLEYAWTLQNKNYYPQTPTGNTILIAQKLWNKYSKFY